MGKLRMVFSIASLSSIWVTISMIRAPMRNEMGNGAPIKPSASITKNAPMASLSSIHSFRKSSFNAFFICMAHSLARKKEFE